MTADMALRFDNLNIPWMIRRALQTKITLVSTTDFLNKFPKFEISLPYFALKIHSISLSRLCPPNVECIALLVYFSSTPIFCLSRPCHTHESCITIFPSSFFYLPLLLVPNLGCHCVSLFVHLLSFLQAKCPVHLHFDCFILTMTSVTPVCFLMAELLILSRNEIFNICRSKLSNKHKKALC